jgi:adenosylhomocysteine nucleosidase
MILVLTPLQIEQDALNAALRAPLRQEERGGVRVTFSEQAFATATGGHGKVQFALTAQHLIRELSPTLIICAGACGAIAPNLKPLDVVVATETVEHDFRLKFVKRPLPAFTGDNFSLSRLREFKVSEFGLHFGKIASGDEDVIETVRAEEIRKQTGALAVAWEGAGGARACGFHKQPFLEVRAVTDSAGPNAVRQFNENVKRGMINILEVVRTLV